MAVNKKTLQKEKSFKEQDINKSNSIADATKILKEQNDIAYSISNVAEANDEQTDVIKELNDRIDELSKSIYAYNEKKADVKIERDSVLKKLRNSVSRSFDAMKESIKNLSFSMSFSGIKDILQNGVGILIANVTMSLKKIFLENKLAKKVTNAFTSPLVVLFGLMMAAVFLFPKTTKAIFNKISDYLEQKWPKTFAGLKILKNLILGVVTGFAQVVKTSGDMFGIDTPWADSVVEMGYKEDANLKEEDFNRVMSGKAEASGFVKNMQSNFSGLRFTQKGDGGKDASGKTFQDRRNDLKKKLEEFKKQGLFSEGNLMTGTHIGREAYSKLSSYELAMLMSDPSYDWREESSALLVNEYKLKVAQEGQVSNLFDKEGKYKESFKDTSLSKHAKVNPDAKEIREVVKKYKKGGSSKAELDRYSALSADNSIYIKTLLGELTNTTETPLDKSSGTGNTNINSTNISNQNTKVNGIAAAGAEAKIPPVVNSVSVGDPVKLADSSTALPMGKNVFKIGSNNNTNPNKNINK